MARESAPKLSRAQCAQFIQDILARRHAKRGTQAEELWIAYTDYCGRIARVQLAMPKLSLPNGSKLSLPWQISEELKHDEYLHDIANDAMQTFLKQCQAGRFQCQDAQVTTYLYGLVTTAILDIVVLDRKDKDGQWREYPGLKTRLEHEESGHDMGIFADGVAADHSVAASRTSPNSGEDSTVADTDEQVESAQKDSAQHNKSEKRNIEQPDDTNALDDHLETTEVYGPAPRAPYRRPDPVLAELIGEEVRERVRHCIEQLPPNERIRIQAEISDGDVPLNEVAKALNVSPQRVTELGQQAVRHLAECMAPAGLLERVPRLHSLIEVLDASLCVHYVRGLGDPHYRMRCRAGIERALETSQADLEALIAALIEDRRAKGMNDQIAKLDYAHQDERRQRILILALWCRVRVRYVAARDRLCLDVMKGDASSYLPADQHPAV